MQGASMLSLIKAKDDGAVEAAWHDRPAYAQADYPRLSFGWSALQTWRTGKYLYVQAPHPELYNQTADPKAENNLASTSKAVADTLAARMNAFRVKTSSQLERPEVAVDPEAEQKLAALGYVASSSSNSKSTDQGPDPKDRTQALHLIEKLPSVLEDGRFAEAIPMLLDLIVKEPNISQLYLKLAKCYMGLKQYDKAIPVLRKALELYPGNIGVEMSLGKALLETRDFDGAATAFKNVLARKPKVASAHTLLEATYLRSNRFSEAINECEKVLADLPEDYDSNLILGLSLVELGEREAAVPKLQKASAVHPQAPEPHMVLSVIYAKLGRTADAELERAEAIRLGAKPHASPDTSNHLAPDANSGSAKQE
jgi:predicted Zn-dependent protease